MPADNRILETGQTVELKVIFHKEKLSFGPVFMDFESMLLPEKKEEAKTDQYPYFPDYEGYDFFTPRRTTYSSGSVRFFNPVNSSAFDLQSGEIWLCRIKSFKITESRARDERRYIFFDVEIISRKETIENEFEREANEWITRILSGSTAVREQHEPAERKTRDFRAKLPAHFAQYFGQQQEVVLNVEEIWVGGNVVRQKVIGGMKREAYEKTKKDELGKIKHPFGGTISPKMMKKMISSIPTYDNLPILPADIEIPPNLVIY
jgi:hypothetical protein